MQAKSWVRPFHRWVSVAFVASVIATTIAMSQKEPLIWVVYVPLLPLGLLTFTGIYLFARPYFANRRTAQRAG
ncbi:MAG: hypothetical protein EON93_20125 [Burkholderiales bacterium]|nr:MAG: hypothetical protein EON93_20125 [Burkholderiales bacterium]